MVKKIEKHTVKEKVSNIELKKEIVQPELNIGLVGH